jgi:predicted PurR-regulated permease PerM
MSRSATLPVPRWIWLALGVGALLWFVFAVRGILLPFVLGLAIAYLLDPAADRLERWMPRWLATVVALILFFGALLGILFLAAPILTQQFAGIIRVLPGYLEKIRPLLMDLVNQAGGTEQAKGLVSQYGGRIVSFVGERVGQVLAGGLQAFNILAMLLIAPVVAFYLLRDWDGIVAQITSLLPQDNAPVIRRLMGEADEALSGFVRGQLTVCLCNAILYGVGWSLVGLEYAVVLGLITGLLAFIPFVGAFFGVSLAVITALGQFGLDPLHLGLVLGVYAVVQAVEGNILIPKLVGDRVNLHAVWVIFALFAGGELMGFVGVFLAVPVAAVLAVLARYGLERYRASRFYGQPKPDPEAP